MSPPFDVGKEAKRTGLTHPRDVRHAITDEPGKPTPKKAPARHAATPFGYSYEFQWWTMPSPTHEWTRRECWFPTARRRDQAMKHLAKQMQARLHGVCRYRNIQLIERASSG